MKLIFGISLGTIVVLFSINLFAREPLTFEERIKAQEAIERVYYSHRIWPKENPQPKPPFEKMVTREQIEAKVTDYLKKSAALDQFWQRPIEGKQLQAEMDRMAAGTKDPETLKELFTVLNNDPYLIAECLARPILAERLIKNWQDDENDLGEKLMDGSVESEKKHPCAVARLEEPSREQLNTGSCQFHLPVVRNSKSVSYSDSWMSSSMDGEIDARSKHTAIWTGTEMIVWGGDNGDIGLRTGGRYNPATDTWIATSTGMNCPEARMNHTAVWTGTEMIIWGGNEDIGHFVLSSGGRYNPQTDTWLPTSTGAGRPEARCQQTAVWTGSVMIVWGGMVESCCDFTNTGGQYNPNSDSWTETSTSGECPSARNLHTAIWTGDKMIVWGGWGVENGLKPYNTGGIYDPLSDIWEATSVGGPCPEARCAHCAVWTGSEMIVWGGYSSVSNVSDYMNTGGRFNPSTGQWTATSTGSGCPARRAFLSPVWDGEKMIVWGGFGPDFGDENSGSSYSPRTNSWTIMRNNSTTPSQRHWHTAVWTGKEMIVWGGTTGCVNCSSDQPPFNSGARYAPASDSWVPTSTGNGAPERRLHHTALWTGAEMIVWGGEIQNIPGNHRGTNTGGTYLPSTDSWTTTSILGDCPKAREGHTAVWTGAEMIIWGGLYEIDSGGRYNPFADSWMKMSTGAGAPFGRDGHTAVWTGSKMVIWGGQTISGPHQLNDGARYDPEYDAWLPTSQSAGCPTPRAGHSGVWTGSRMLIWGGSTYRDEYTDGAFYDPNSDSWETLEPCPADLKPGGARTAVWTGKMMIVWGGDRYGDGAGTGACYDNSTREWSMCSTGSDCPHDRAGHTAVWCGNRMVVFGGDWWDSWGHYTLNDGGVYDPVANAWEPLNMGKGLPSPRSYHTAVWTGSEMILWGGTPMTSTGGIYNLGPRPPSPPVVSDVYHKGNPFRIFVKGDNFQDGFNIYLAGQQTPWSNIVPKDHHTVVIKGASSLFPKTADTYVDIRIVNPDSGEVTVQYDRKTKAWRIAGGESAY